MTEKKRNEPSLQRTADPDERLFHDELTELRIDRIGQRLTLISVLLPILIIVILTLGYLDLKRRVIGLQDSGSATVQHLSNDLESRFSTLSVRVAELEQSLEKRLTDLDRKAADQATRLAPIAADLKRLASEKADRGEIKAATAALEKQLPPIVERLGSQEQALGALKGHIEAQNAGLARSIESVTADLAALQTHLAAVEGNLTGIFEDMKQIKEARQALQVELTRIATLKADQKAVDAALQHQLETVQGQLQATAESLNKRLERLTQRLEQTERAPTPAAPPPRPPVQPVPKPPPAPATGPPTAVPAEARPVPVPDIKPGQIIEKPLQ